ncbi:MAG: HAMP domain-containing histidine kinase, partial [Nitrospirota bacterium]|nr:HAMP domain-containing histidine kinase [Nitrospirota bacterium]
RTPMTSIKGYVENLLDGINGPLNPRQAQSLERVKCNADRLTRMTNELLDLSRIEAGLTDLHLAPLRVPELVAEVWDSAQAFAQPKSIALRQQYDNALPPVIADRDKVQQILTNLLHNAVKFTPQQGSIVVEATTLNQYVLVCVTDSGCGIPEQELVRVFEKFYRGPSAPIEARGAGLGLSITKSLVELHGGKIWATSNPGQGSQFAFTLPIETPAKSDLPKPSYPLV